MYIILQLELLLYIKIKWWSDCFPPSPMKSEWKAKQPCGTRRTNVQDCILVDHDPARMVGPITGQLGAGLASPVIVTLWLGSIVTLWMSSIEAVRTIVTFCILTLFHEKTTTMEWSQQIIWVLIARADKSWEMLKPYLCDCVVVYCLSPLFIYCKIRMYPIVFLYNTRSRYFFIIEPKVKYMYCCLLSEVIYLL